MCTSFEQPETGGLGRRDGREDGSGSRATGWIDGLGGPVGCRCGGTGAASAAGGRIGTTTFRGGAADDVFLV